MSETKRKVPKLRFPGFTEDWEQRKVSEVFKITRGQVLAANLTSDKKTEINKYPVFSSQTKDNGLMGYYSEFLFENAITWTTDGANAGTVRYRKGKFYSTNVNGVLLNDDGLACTALSEIIDKVAYKYVSHVGNPKLMNNVMANIDIIIPNDKEELIQISKIIETFDKSITLHQRKLENLKLKKKALLQKLFPKNGEQFPELRFPGFTDAWEQRKLSDFTERVVRKNGEESDRPLTISAQDGLVDQREYFNRQVASKDMSNYYLIKNGEFAYNKSYSEGYPFGAIKRLDYYESGALSTLYIVFKLIDANVLSVFIVAYYMTHLWYGEISKRASEGARNHGLLNISPADFFQSEMLIPTNVNEQRLIGKFFEDFENLITLHQRKLEHLQLQKKALLQQMFI